MKELTEKRIFDFCTRVLFIQKSIYDFILDPHRVKKYKRYQVSFMISAMGFVMVLAVTAFMRNPFLKLAVIPMAVVIGITGKRMNSHFKESESLRKKSYKYFQSERLITYLKVELKMSQDTISKYEEKCIKRGDKAATLSFATFIGILLAIVQVWISIPIYLQKDKTIENSVLVIITIFLTSIVWLIFRSVYTDIINRETNVYKKIAELLSENNYN